MDDATPAYIASDELNSRLAYDLATELRSLPEIMGHYGLTEAQMRQFLSNRVFQEMVREARAKFMSGLSTPERIQAKAQMALEGAIAPMYGIIHNKDTNTGQRIDATKVLASIAGLNKGDVIPQAAQKFVLNINLGDKQVGITADPQPITIDQK